MRHVTNSCHLDSFLLSTYASALHLPHAHLLRSPSYTSCSAALDPLDELELWSAHLASLSDVEGDAAPAHGVKPSAPLLDKVARGMWLSAGVIDKPTGGTVPRTCS